MNLSLATKEKFIDFVLAQPDDRPISMADIASNEDCGCVMVHFGKEVLGLKDFACHFDYWYYHSDLPNLKKIVEIKGLSDFIRALITYMVRNYGEAKKYIDRLT